MKTGDTVIISDRNRNHLDNGTCAYSGMKGVVTHLYEDGAFALNCGSSVLVVPMNNADKSPKKGIWIYLNGVLIFHERKYTNAYFNGKDSVIGSYKRCMVCNKIPNAKFLENPKNSIVWLLNGNIEYNGQLRYSKVKV